MTTNSMKFKYFLITGEPGVGKTTMTKKISSIIQQKGIKTVGFYTEEIRKGGVREGFDIVTLDGVRGRLARDQSLIETPVKNRVGKYAVLIEEFEKLAMSTLSKAEPSSLLVIDEIGKMEFFSVPFKSKVKELFSPSGDLVVLATIPVRKSDQLMESIRNNRLAKLWTVTRENRNNLHEDIVKEILEVAKA